MKQEYLEKTRLQERVPMQLCTLAAASAKIALKVKKSSKCFAEILRLHFCGKSPKNSLCLKCILGLAPENQFENTKYNFFQ